ncbi:MAG: HD domain-containing protein [Rhizomicrobium sp.]
MFGSHEPYEIRDPIHGFVRLNQLEWDIINHASFQRLHRIRQLAWTDLVYPGAMHTRFEHSLGVMHVASRLFDAVVRRSGDVLKADYGLDDGMLSRQRRIIRMAALLHDVGHGPFSHAAEDVFPLRDDGTGRYQHEDYSDAIVRDAVSDVIDNHREAKASGIGIDDILSIFSGLPATSGSLVWKDIVSGQMDADRMDYLLRDAHHAGVQYGRYDLDRLVYAVQLCEEPGDHGHHIGVDEDGIHAVEGLLIARYMMFTQLYFHKTRSILDYHYEECLKHLLKESGGVFPLPSSVGKFLEWDDWRVAGAIAAGHAGPHGKMLKDRMHYRKVFNTSEVMGQKDVEVVSELTEKLAPLGGVLRDASKSWYKAGPDEIRVRCTSGGIVRVVPLASLSPVVSGLKAVNQRRLYVPTANRAKAEVIVMEVMGDKNA